MLAIYSIDFNKDYYFQVSHHIIQNMEGQKLVQKYGGALVPKGKHRISKSNL